MRRLACRIFGHHLIRTKGFFGTSPDEFVCLRCFDRADMPSLDQESR